MLPSEKHKKLSLPPYVYADIQYQYVSMFRESEKNQNDYGTGDLYTSLEVHTVTRIEDNPGITVTEIAEQTNRTKGAVSQIITKLENKGLVRREKDPENPRRVCLFVTDDGFKLSRSHKEYDDTYMGQELDRWIALYGYDSVEKFFQIMQDQIVLYTSAKKE